MKLFKHGDALAIVIPEALRKKLGLVEGADFEVLEIEQGLIALATPEYVASSVKSSMVSKLISKLSFSSTSSIVTSGKTQPTTAASALLKVKQSGILIVQNEFAARKMAEELAQELKKGTVIGAHVDKKFYFLSKEYYDVYSNRVKSVISKDSKVDEIVEKSKSGVDAVLAIISILKEQGELLEKTKGKYTLI